MLPAILEVVGYRGRLESRGLRRCGGYFSAPRPPFDDERTRLTKGERCRYESTTTCDSIRPVPRSSASAIVGDETASKTLSPSLNQRR